MESDFGPGQLILELGQSPFIGRMNLVQSRFIGEPEAIEGANGDGHWWVGH